MKVLKNNYGKIDGSIVHGVLANPYPRKHICEGCESELEYDASDLRIGYLGCAYLDCPLCEYDNMLDEDEHSIKLTKDNIKFPEHFYRFSKEANAVELSNNETEKYIRECIEHLRRDRDDGDYYYTGTGDTRVIAFKCDDDEEYYVLVAKDSYEVEIPFEKEDY